ncbi:MAG: cytochrome c oxidase subunit 3 family protein [Bacteroidetes bacterium]|nr:cytochrome c oxidase subunit 3 family protein [Bacteroidota bacterium]
MAHFVLPNSGHNYDPESSKLGMWLFLFTEILLFGGLFIVYFVYRTINADAFLRASYELNITMGTINTIILITSSMTVAMAITALQKGKEKFAINLLWITLLFAIAFLINKYFEWSIKIEHGIFPGMEHYNGLETGQKLYFFLYYFMTGLHALHIIVGAIFIGFVIKGIQEEKVTANRISLLENSGLYWHLVDLIWIYLFPLFYLIN